MSPLSCIWTSVCCLIALLLIKRMSAGMVGEEKGEKSLLFFTLKRGSEWWGKYRRRQLQWKRLARKFSSAHYRVFDPSWAEVQLDGWRTPRKTRASASRLHSFFFFFLTLIVFFSPFASKSSYWSDLKPIWNTFSLLQRGNLYRRMQTINIP